MTRLSPLERLTQHIEDPVNRDHYAEMLQAFVKATAIMFVALIVAAVVITVVVLLTNVLVSIIGGWGIVVGISALISLFGGALFTFLDRM